MFINVSVLWHTVTLSAVQKLCDEIASGKSDRQVEAYLEAAAFMCNIDMELAENPPVIVEVKGDEDYVSDRLPDIS